MAIGGYTTAILMADHGVKDIWTIPVAAVVAGVVGFLFGIPALRLSGLYLALATFAVAVAMPAVIKQFEGFTGGGGGHQPVRRARADRVAHARHRPRSRAHVQQLALLPLLDGRARRLRRRLAAPARSDGPGASAPSATARRRRSRPGVSLAPYKTLAFGVSAAYAGVAGSLFAIATTFVNPDTFPIALSILLLVGVVVGGLGSLAGLIAGAVFIQFLPIWAQEVSKSPGAPAVVSGVVLIALMFVLPMGFAGLVGPAREPSQSADNARATIGRTVTPESPPQGAPPR